MKNQILKKIYRAVVYLRLSDEDGDNRESDSISNQRILIHSFLKSHPEIQVVKECVDDGYTGTNFNRPGFQEMLRMLEEGEADCIIVKDLSRYGRDFSGVLQYVERILPKMGVRLILVNDNYDSLTPNRDFLTLRFKSLINDLYPADTSKSVRSHLYVKMTAGQCVAPFAFYGYLKSEEDKHKLVMDEVAASVVRDIYHMKMQGYSLTDISEELNRRGILTPLRYKQVYLKQKLKTGFRLTEKPVWMPTMVRRILLDERYTGVLIQGKTTTPTLNIRFISVMDEYDSANPACVENRTTNILKHFMNDYYAREVSEKLVQAHRLSRERGEFWGSRPPYGYQRAEENSKKLVPEPEEAEIIRQIFYWYVFEEMSSYDIARELNGKKVLGPEDSYQKRKQGKEPEKRRLWRSDGIRKILQNPVYIGAAVYGKTKQMLAQNIPLQMIPKEQWEVCENAWEAVVERAIYEKAQEIAKERWKDTLDNWAANPKEKQGADGPFKGRIFCGHCGRRLGRSRSGGNEKHKYMVYKCPSFSLTDHTECFRTVNEIYINQAVKAALRYQIQLAVESKKTYGAEFYQKLEQEVAEKIKNARQKYEKYGRKLETLFEHYATGLLDCKEYQEIKSIYQEEQQAARQNMKQIQLRGQHLLDQVKARMDWTEELLKYQRFQKIEKGIADRFIEKITVYSKDYVEIVFWFGDLFEKELEKELDNMEGGLPYAV